MKNTRVILVAAVMVVLVALLLGIYWLSPGTAVHDGSPVKRIAVISVPDIHSAVMPHTGKNGSEVGGLMHAAAVIRTVRREYDGSLLLSSGDDMGNDENGMFFKLFRGVPERKAMSTMGFDAGTIGNHDFDERLEGYRQSLFATTFPILSANIRFNDTGVQSAVRPYLIKDVAGVRIGIFGLSYPDTDEYTPVLDGITIDPEVNLVAAEMVRELRSRNVDLIIALTHLGKVKDRELAESVDGIDLIVGGHDHTYYIDQVNTSTGRKTVMFDGGVYGENVSVFSFRYQGAGIEDPEWEVIPVDGTGGMDRDIAALIEPYTDQYRKWTDTPAGTLDKPLRAHNFDPKTGQSETGAFVTAAMKQYGEGADIAFCPTGSLNRSTAYIPGTITNGELGQMIDHNNRLSWIRLSGRDIVKALETSASFQKPMPDNRTGGISTIHPLVLQMSGITLQVDPSQEKGRRVSNVMITTNNGSVALDPEQEYTIVMNTRIGQFNEGYRVFQDRPASQKTNTDVRILDTVLNYVASPSSVRNPVAAACVLSCG